MSNALWPLQRWHQAEFSLSCPHCRNAVVINGLGLTKDIVGCSDCQHSITLAAVENVRPSGELQFKVGIRQLLLSYEGRVGRLSFLLLGVFPLWIMGAPQLYQTLLDMLWSGASLSQEEETFVVGKAATALLLLSIVGMPISAKRLHDRGKSGHWLWILLLAWVPYLGPLLLLFALVSLGLWPGVPKVNRYGPRPRDCRITGLPRWTKLVGKKLVSTPPRQLALILTVVAILFWLLFPVRDAIFDAPGGRGGWKKNLGPVFVFSEPSMQQVTERLFKSEAVSVEAARHCYSEVNYGKTTLLIIATLVSGGAAIVLTRKF